jgi:Protein of unknown function (DUF3325)
MATLTLSIAAFSLCYAGLGGLSLAMDRHHERVFQKQASAKTYRKLRGAGWLFLGLSGAVCVLLWGASVGAVVWLGILSATALPIILLLHYAPRVVAHSALTSAIIGLLIPLVQK